MGQYAKTATNLFQKQVQGGGYWWPSGTGLRNERSRVPVSLAAEIHFSSGTLSLTSKKFEYKVFFGGDVKPSVPGTSLITISSFWVNHSNKTRLKCTVIAWSAQEYLFRIHERDILLSVEMSN